MLHLRRSALAIWAACFFFDRSRPSATKSCAKKTKRQKRTKEKKMGRSLRGRQQTCSTSTNTQYATRLLDRFELDKPRPRRLMTTAMQGRLSLEDNSQPEAKRGKAAGQPALLSVKAALLQPAVCCFRFVSGLVCDRTVAAAWASRERSFVCVLSALSTQWQCSHTG